MELGLAYSTYLWIRPCNIVTYVNKNKHKSRWYSERLLLIRKRCTPWAAHIGVALLSPVFGSHFSKWPSHLLILFEFFHMHRGKCHILFKVLVLRPVNLSTNNPISFFRHSIVKQKKTVIKWSEGLEWNMLGNQYIFVHYISKLIENLISIHLTTETLQYDLQLQSNYFITLESFFVFYFFTSMNKIDVIVRNKIDVIALSVDSLFCYNKNRLIN